MTAMLDVWPAPADFRRDALCAQIDAGDLFFPEKGEKSTDAKRVCFMCPVRPECAEYAITSPANPHGIWGATSMRERAAIRAERGISDVHYDSQFDKCGTEAGAKRHWRAGERVCEPCLLAARKARAERRA